MTNDFINSPSEFTKNLRQPLVQNDGKMVTIFFNKNYSSAFHAIWLWQNDRSNIMIPSGQRKQSPGCYNGKATIVKAEIHSYSFIEEELLRYPLLVTKVGAIHPINTNVEEISKNVPKARTTKTISNNSDETTNNAKLVDLPQILLVIQWNQPICKEFDTDEMNARSVFNLQWLKDWAYDTSSLESSRLGREISIEHTFIHKYKDAIEKQDQHEIHERSRHKGLISADYNDVTNEHNRDGLIMFLDALFLDGAAIITDSPSVENESDPNNVVCTVGKIIGGSLSHGYLYGDTFHVKSTTNAINVAYTSRELGPHQDLTYYESKPGFQLLHCASMPPNIIGGESILIDSMAAAHTFRQIAPDLFATLVNCPATFVKDREGARMTYSRPHIVLQSDYCGRRGTNTNTNDNDIDIASNGEIVGVHWAPPFEGPLRIHPNCVEDYYRAYAAFELMLDDTKCPLACSQATGLDLSLTTELASFGNDYTWQSRLKAGEIMVFNNTRMLHGRRSFELPKSTETEETETDMERHLIGAYTNIDDSLNRYRVFLNEMDLHRIIPNVGNGSQSALPP